MIDNFKYLRVFKMADIPPDEGTKICSFLTNQTLDRLTKKGFDRRIIKPVIQKAECMQGGINDKNVNLILDDANLIISMMAIYCR